MDADAVLQQGMSMTLLSMVRDNEHKTQGVPQGGTTNLETPQGVDKIKGPVAQDLCAKIGEVKQQQGAENDWATSGELRLGIVKESRCKVLFCGRDL